MSVAVGDCTRCSSPLESGDLRCAICAQAAPIPDARIDRVRVEVLRCDGCGAAITYDVKVRAPRCAFCGSTLHVEEREDPPEQAEGYLPFTVDARQAREALRRWLGGLGFFRPGDLKTEATVDALQPLHWPGWLFDAEALASWTADTNAGKRKADWAPHAGQTPLLFERILVAATRGLTNDEAGFVTVGYDPDSARPEPEGAEESTIERFDTQRSAARGRILDALRATADARVAAQLPGNRHRKLKVELLLRNLRTRRLAFPAWVLAYRYRDEPYRAVICGQDASLVRGEAPTSWWRVAAVAAAVVLGAGALLALLAAAS